MAQRFRPVIEVAGRPEPLTHCLRLSISQAIFDHHQFEIVVPHAALEEPASAGFFGQAHHALCGKRVTISFEPIDGRQPKPAFRFVGLITRLRLGSANDLASVYLIEGYSPTYLLEDSAQRRTFVGQTAKQIGDRVVSDYAGNVLRSEIAPRPHAPIPYAVQYDENNFTFLKRLAASQGEWLYYTGTGLRLGPAVDTAPVPFVVGGAQSFALSVSLRPTRFRAAEYNYRAHQTLQATSAGPAAGGSGPLAAFASQASAALFPQAFQLGAGPWVRTQGQLEEAVQLLRTNLNGSLVEFEGVGESPDVAVGGLISVYQPGPDTPGPGTGTGTGTGADRGRYRVLAVEHWLDDAGNYVSKFRAVPAGPGAVPAPWLPPVAAGGLELAEVVDGADPRGLGRIRVRYPWPVARPQDAESDWLRVSTPYSGDGKGHLFTPEVGSQVLVGYEQGLAERPVVLGNLFHPRNKQGARYTTPNNELKGLQTAGGNKVVMSEVAGAQTILLSNSNKKGTSVLVSFAGDGSVHIKTDGPINLTAGKDITLEAGENIVLRAGADITLAAQQSVSVAAREESISIRAQKELLLTAVRDDLTLEAASQKLVARAADNVEIRAAGTTKINGQDLKLNQPG